MLTLKFPIEPMMARPLDALPAPGTVREPIWQQKLDGYRVIVFISSGKARLQSRKGADLTAAFPEIAAAASAVEQDLVLDAELVVFRRGRLDFEALQQRARRTGAGAAAAAIDTPAHVVAFDVLEAHGEVLLHRPFRDRWEHLQMLFHRGVLSSPWTLVTSTEDRATAESWLSPLWGRVGVEGVVVKPAGQPYQEGVRGWWKVRTFETADAIVGAVTGSPTAPRTLLLGRYDAGGSLRFVGRSTPLRPYLREELGAVLIPGDKSHGWDRSRFSASWDSRQSLAFTTVKPVVIVEIRVDTAVDRGRYRHPVRVLRTRDDLELGDVTPSSPPA
ncbi:ATP-dependent DNA ligase [Streptomyces sp. NPDC054865]